MPKSIAQAQVEFSLGNNRYCIRNGQLCDIAGELVVLRAKSAQVLKYLLDNNDMIVSKEAIALVAWPDSVASDESIGKCISDIRKAIGDDKHAILQTYPKRGYRINAVYAEAAIPRSRTTFNPVVLWAVALTLIVIVTNKVVQPDSMAELALPANTILPSEIEKGREALNKFTYEHNLIAERHFRTAVEQDPKNALAYAELVAAFAIRLENGWAVLTRADEQRAFFYSQRAIELDPDLWLAHYASGRLHAVTGSDLALASKYLQKAMSLRPGSDDARVYFAAVKIFQGYQGEAIPIFEAALASNPAPPFWYYLGYGHALFQAKRYQEAEIALSKCLSQMPNAPYCLRFQIANFAQLGQIEDAEWAIEEYSALGHTATFSAIMNVLQDRDVGNRKHIADSLKKAGVRD